MLSVFNRPSPHDIFTPRASSFNSKIYVERPELERRVAEALRSTLHLIIHGESGNGKTWLYQKVFLENKVETMLVNMATASFKDDLSAAFKERVDREGESVKTSQETTATGGGTIAVAKIDIAYKDHFDIGQKDYFERCLEILRKKAGSRSACLVFDNFEQILDNQKLVKQVSDVIILLDDPNFSKYKIKIVIVGVPNDIKKYFSQARNTSTLSNRLREVQEVARLSKEQTGKLIRKGFLDELKYNIMNDELERIINHTAWVTDRIAQHVQEYCLELALIAERNERQIKKDMLMEADRNWMVSSLNGDYAVVESNMNARDTRESRRNQTIYALGVCEKEDFKHSDIEKVVKQEFPASTSDVQLNISQQLSKISGGTSPLIKRTPDGNSYRFVNPKYKMCVRAMLRKVSGEKVEKVPISDFE